MQAHQSSTGIYFAWDGPGGGQGKYGVKVRVATFPRDMTVVS